MQRGIDMCATGELRRLLILNWENVTRQTSQNMLILPIARKALRQLTWRRWLMLTGLGVLMVAGVLLEGCQGPTRPTALEGVSNVEAATGVVVETGVLASQSGCLFDYDLYRPAGTSGAAQVVLAHGFLRNRERMQDLARALAKAGFATASIDLCNMRPWDGAHEANAADMRLTANTLGRPEVVYAGFSAGGLAALLAASGDPDSLGVVVLDLVDQGALGRQAAADLQVPVVGLFGAPSRCNANGNGLPVLVDVVGVEVERFADATHCDFESPTDNLCRLLCEPNDRDPDDAARQRSRVVASTVAAVSKVWQSANVSAVDASND